VVVLAVCRATKLECKGDPSRRVNRDPKILDFSNCGNPKIFSENPTNEITVYTLLANNNKITKIESDDFENLPFVKKIVLSHNQISDIADNAFRTCDKLEEIYLDNNPIGVLKSLLFTNLRPLKMIDFSKCGITQIEIDTFVGLQYLETLNLEGNVCANKKIALGTDTKSEDLNSYFFEKTECMAKYCTK
jgi:Leucine-rich repeat (LRR) protein